MPCNVNAHCTCVHDYSAVCTYIHNIHTHGCCDLSLTCYSIMFKVTQIRRLRLLFDHAICTNVMSIGNDKVLSMQCAQYSYRRMLWPIVDLLFHNVHLLQQAAAAPSCPARAQPKQISPPLQVSTPFLLWMQFANFVLFWIKLFLLGPMVQCTAEVHIHDLLQAAAAHRCRPARAQAKKIPLFKFQLWMQFALASFFK